MTTRRAIKAIRGYYADPDTPEAKVLFDWAAKQRAGIAESEVDQIAQGAEIGRTFVIRALRELARLRFGEFIVGRRTRPSRMKWAVALRDIGRCAQGEDVEFDAPVASRPYLPEPARIPDDENVIVHAFHLRPGLKVSLRLPADLTAVEAGRLADFVRSLPFEGTDQ